MFHSTLYTRNATSNTNRAVLYCQVKLPSGPSADIGKFPDLLQEGFSTTKLQNCELNNHIAAKKQKQNKKTLKDRKRLHQEHLIRCLGAKLF